MVRKAILICGGGVVVLGIAFAVLLKPVGRMFFYHRATPATDMQMRTWANRPGWRVDHFEVEPGVRLAGLVRAPKDPDAPMLVLFHGNAGTGVGAVPGFFDGFAAERDWGAAAYSYRGFGASGGKPSEAVIMSDAVAIVKHLTQTLGVNPSRIVPVGTSLGAGVALKLSAELKKTETPPCATLAVAAYTSLQELIDSRTALPIGWAVPDAYDVLAFIEEVPGPVLFIHGTEDQVVPISHPEALAARLGPAGRVVPAYGRGHNNAWGDRQALTFSRKFVDDNCGRYERSVGERRR